MKKIYTRTLLFCCFTTVESIETMGVKTNPPKYNIGQYACKGDWESVKKLVEQEQVDINTKYPKNGNTALHYAVTEGPFETIEFLIQHKANLNERGTWGERPIHRASRRGNIKIFKYLVKNGANIHEEDDRETSLHIASQWGHLEIVAYLAEKQHVPLDTINWFFGDTALHLAVQYNHPNIVEYLLKKGANVHIKSSLDDNTPLHTATEKNYFEIITLLLHHGADTNALNKKKKKPSELTKTEQGIKFKTFVERFPRRKLTTNLFINFILGKYFINQ